MPDIYRIPLSSDQSWTFDTPQTTNQSVQTKLFYSHSVITRTPCEGRFYRGRDMNYSWMDCTGSIILTLPMDFR